MRINASRSVIRTRVFWAILLIPLLYAYSSQLFAQGRSADQIASEHARIHGQKWPEDKSTLKPGETKTKMPPREFVDPNAAVPTQGQFMQTLACKSDAVVLGVVQDSHAALTDNHKFIFTDYNVKVAEVLRSPRNHNINTGDAIVVTRIGGELVIEGHLTTALDMSTQPLQPGVPHLLFLKYLPQTSTFIADGPFSAFAEHGPAFNALTTTQARPVTDPSRGAMLSDVRQGLALCQRGAR